MLASLFSSALTLVATQGGCWPRACPPPPLPPAGLGARGGGAPTLPPSTQQSCQHHQLPPKHLDPAVAPVCHNDVPVGIHGHACRGIELPISLAVGAKLEEKLSVSTVDLREGGEVAWQGPQTPPSEEEDNDCSAQSPATCRAGGWVLVQGPTLASSTGGSVPSP